MGHTDPELLDAYRETAQAVLAERLRGDRLIHRRADLARALRHPLTPWISPMWADGTPADLVSIGRDFAAWLLERQDERELAACLFDAAARSKTIAAYINERAEADAAVADRRTDWRAEALEASEWTRGGQP